MAFPDLVVDVTASGLLNVGGRFSMSSGNSDIEEAIVVLPEAPPPVAGPVDRLRFSSAKGPGRATARIRTVTAKR